MEVVAVTCVSLGLVHVGSCDAKVSTYVLNKLLELQPQDLKLSCSR